MKKMDLCGACVAKLGEAYNLRKVAGGVDNKVVCSNCGRRRYGGTYEVEVKRKRGEAGGD